MRLRRFFVWWCASVLALYAVAGWRGWGAQARVQKAPASIREQPGGYRAYTYWRPGK